MYFERGFWEPYEKSLLYRLAESIAEGDGREIVTFLGAHLEGTLGNSHRSDELRTALRKHGLPPLDLNGDQRVPDGIERLQARFCSALEPYLICSGVLSRPEPKQLVERMLADGGARLLFVTGDAGSGKSGVLLESAGLLAKQNVPYLPIRLDTHYPDRAVRAYSRERLDLPASPGICLRSLAGGRRAVLIIDQLDAVRWTSANSDVGWERCKEIIDEALGFSNITVVVAGRTVDLEDDQRIKHWKKGKEVGQPIEVEPFQVGRMPEDVVASVLGQYGVAYASLLPREKDLLSNAQSLQLWWRLAEDNKVGTFSSRAALLGSYWGHYRDKAVDEFAGVTFDGLNGLLDQLVEFMDTQGRLDAPNALLERDRAATAALCGLGILDRTNGTTRFAHQSHLDYLTIERVFQRSLQGEVSAIEWLRGHDQSLFRRDQVRFLLQLLRDQAPRLYSEFLQNIFCAEGIRFHIQHLSLTTLAQADPPNDSEHTLIKFLLDDELWRLHVLELVLAGKAAWLERLRADGTIPSMLSSDDETKRNEALFLCYRSAESAPHWFERVLAPHWDSGDPEWVELIGSRLAINAERDTPTVFQWRLAHARSGADHHGIHSIGQLASKDQCSAISYLGAIAEGLVSNVEKGAAGDEQLRVHVDTDLSKELLDACEQHPRHAWDSLQPVHAHAIATEEALTEAGYYAQDSARQIVSILHRCLHVSGAALLQGDGASFLAELRALGQKPPGHARRLAVDVLATTTEELVDDAVSCFLSVECPLDIDASPESMTQSDGLSRQDPAIGALRTLAHACSDGALRRIEVEVLGFHADYERRSVEWQLDLIREGKWRGHPNHYGLPQYALLLVLPEDRLSSRSARVLRMWRGKFGELSMYRHARSIEALPAGSPIPRGKAKFISDDVWVQIVKGEWSGRDNKWREPKDGRYIEYSPSNFAWDLEGAGKLNPPRYVRLGFRLPKDANECYYTALLRVAGVVARPDEMDASWTAARAEDTEALIAHIVDRESTEIAKGICRVVGERSGEPWSEGIFRLLRKYALDHPHPGGSAWPDSSENQDEGRSLEVTALNSVRGSAIKAASQLLWAHPDLLDWAKELAERVVEDPHPAVRAASFDLVLAIGKHDLDLSLSLMVRAYDGADDAVISVLRGPRLILHLWRREAELTPVFERALASADEKTVELAAYWTTVGNTLEGLYTGMASQAADSPTAVRVGVVRALVDVATQWGEHRAGCLDRLAGFLEDEDEEVLRAVDSVFRRDGFLESEEAPAFAEAFIRSGAFGRDPSSFLHRLREFEGSLLRYANAIEESVVQLSGPLATETQSLGSRHGMAGRVIPTVLLRLYQQSEGLENADLKSRCLDKWDALLKARVGSGEAVLQKIDS